MNISFDSSDDGGDRRELFTPIRGSRKSLIQETPSYSTATEESTPGPKMNFKNSQRKSAATENQKNESFFADDTPNTLPKLHNNSWLGADMSPIRKGQDEILEGNDADEHENEDAAIVAPYRLGLAATSSSSVAASESFFMNVHDDVNDLEEKNSKKQTPEVTKNYGFAATLKSKVVGRGTSSSGYVRPRPRIPLFHPRNATADPGLGATGEEEKYGNQQKRPRRRRLLNPFQRKFWTFWSALTSSPSENDSSSSYVMMDGPARLATHGGTMNSIQSGNLYVIGATAFVFFCVGMHDGFLAYLAFRRGIDASEQDYGLAWTLPWIAPTQRSLLRFGAFCPDRLLQAFFSSSPPEYWRSFTSMLVPISLIEWLLLAWVWTRYLPSSVFSRASKYSWQLSWPVVYLLSAWTGQLWMTAFHYETIRSSLSNEADAYGDESFSIPDVSGCAGWATAGVLCCVGIQAPNRRFPCFVSSIVLVVLHQCQATGSVVGCAAASFFGWAYSGLWSSSSPQGAAWMSRKRWQEHQREMLHRDFTYYHDVLHDGGNTTTNEHNRWTLWHVLAAIVVFLLWFSPIIFLRYR